MKWFKDGINTLEELRQIYQELLKRYHPDNQNGSVQITQEINKEYDFLFHAIKENENSDSQFYTYEANEHFKLVINNIIGFSVKESRGKP